MKDLNKKKLENQMLIINLLFVITIGVFLAFSLLVSYFIYKQEMSLVAKFLNLTDFELFWYSPYIFGGITFVIMISVVLILSLKANTRSKLYSIYFNDGKEFLYNENGISFSISKDTNWICKDSKFIKNEIEISVPSCKIKEQSVKNNMQ